MGDLGPATRTPLRNRDGVAFCSEAHHDIFHSLAREAQLGNYWGHSDGTMRVLVVDQEPEMLEAVARAFEVDVATTKATCIDLLRANDFDVLIACERLNDGSGLELLSHVGQRWPHVLRILAIEPSRRQMLRGRLGPFRLFDTIPYPIDEVKLEAALTRASEALAASDPADIPQPPMEESEPIEPPAREFRTNTVKPNAKPQRSAASSRSGKDARKPARPGQVPKAAQKPPTYPPLPSKGSKIEPLGSPTSPVYRILPHDYHAQTMPGTLRHRRDDEPEKEPSLQRKAAALAAEAMAAVVRYIKSKDDKSTAGKPTAGPRKKR